MMEHLIDPQTIAQASGIAAKGCASSRVSRLILQAFSVSHGLSALTGTRT
jgi:hypothetical protein